MAPAFFRASYIRHRECRILHKHTQPLRNTLHVGPNSFENVALSS